MAGESQYWSLQNPMLNPNYANQIGLPGVNSNFMITGTLNEGVPVITNYAGALGPNAGGAIQVVTANRELYEYLLALASKLKSRGSEHLSQTLMQASRHAAGMS